MIINAPIEGSLNSKIFVNIVPNDQIFWGNPVKTPPERSVDPQTAPWAMLTDNHS